MARFLKTLLLITLERFVTETEERFKMRKLKKEKKCFKHFSYDSYAANVTFQKFNSLSGDKADRKYYLSDKDMLYRYEAGLLALSTRLCIECSSCHSGLVFEQEILWINE